MSAAPSTTPDEAGSAQRTPPTPQLNRSCESCRTLKVRCLPDPTSLNQCQRCAKAKRACVFVAPQRRRPRKRTDSRVAQLEKEMRQMRSLLKDRFAPEESGSENSGSQSEDEAEADFEPESREAFPEAPSSTSGSTRHIDPSPGVSSYPAAFDNGSVSTASFNAPIGRSPEVSSQGDDVVDRGVISLDQANRLIAFFITELTVFAPMILLPPDTSASQLRRSKPVLFLSVIAAAALSVDADLAAVLNREMVRLYADRFFINGDKSLELVQALLLMVVFYYPPDSPLKLQYYQYTHIAATMALEIGLASKRKVSNGDSNSNSGKGRKAAKHVFNEQMAEQARAILGCYHLASIVAMKTRRPNLLLFNDWMGECVKHLNSSPNAVDRHKAIWFELQRIVDESMTSFGLDDTSSTAPLTEARVQAVLRWFDNRMQSWRKNTPQDMMTVPMSFEYHHTNLAIYELAVGEGYRDPDAIKRQYYALPSPEPGAQPVDTQLSAVRVDITVKWMNAAQELLDFFLCCDTDLLRKLPNLVYTRVGVAFMSLLKIHYFVQTGPLGDFVSPQAVNVDTYLDVMTRRLTEASGGGKYRVPTRWHFVVAVKGRSWYDRFQQQQQTQQEDNSLAPPMSATSPTPQHSMPFQNPSPFSSSQPPLPLGIGDTEAPPIQGYHAMAGGYGAPASGPGVMDTMWPPEQQSFFSMNQFPAYRPPVMPAQFFHEDIQQQQQQQRSPAPQHGGFSQPPPPPPPPQTGMELDGWVPDGSIYGMPSLPGL